MARALQAEDSAARLILEEVGEDLAFGLSHAVHLFHPEVIVLGGGLSLIGEPLRAAVAQALPAFVMEAFAGGPHIRLAALGEDSVPAGCLIAARQLVADELPATEKLGHNIPKTDSLWERIFVKIPAIIRRLTWR